MLSYLRAPVTPVVSELSLQTLGDIHLSTRSTVSDLPFSSNELAEYDGVEQIVQRAWNRFAASDPSLEPDDEGHDNAQAADEDTTHDLQ
jgi:hypothetical protein